MMWEKVKLGDICKYVTSGGTPKSSIKEYYEPKQIPWLKTKEVNYCRIYETESYISKDGLDNSSAKMIPQNSVIVAMYGQGDTAGRVAINKIPLTTNQACCNLIIDETKACYEFVYYQLVTLYEKMVSLKNGGAQPNLNAAIIKSMEIKLPPLKTQRYIADILSSYDNLIENNQKQIKLLEEAAQRLYKEWFVDLHFPGHENTKIVDGVPEGWSKSTVGNICKLRKVVITPDKIESNTPYIGLEHMPRNDICLSTWGKSEEINSNKFIYLKKDVLFGKIRPYFHKVGFALNDGITSTDTMVMVADQNLWGLLLVTVSSDAFVDFSYQNCKEGAKMPRADWKQMEKYAIMIADQATQKLFEQEILVITNKISALAFQCRSLREARDRMLPKLMGGEVEA